MGTPSPPSPLFTPLPRTLTESLSSSSSSSSPSSSAPTEDWFAWLQTFYELDFLASKSSSDISWIGSTQAFLMFIVSAIVGPIVDAGYMRSLLVLGALLTVLGMCMTSLCTAYWQVFLAQALTMGLGFGCLHVPAPTIISQYFHARTALAMGASSAGTAIGGVIYPIIFTRPQPASASAGPPDLVDRTAFRDVPYLLNTGLILVIINASSLPGRLIPGYYADRIGSINVQTVVALVGAVMTFAPIAIHTTPGLLSADRSKIGTRLGMTLAVLGCGVLVSTPIAGAILNRGHGGEGRHWVGLIVRCGALLSASVVAMATTRIWKIGLGFKRVI
ncbi:uncharacterized protein BO95DRAFT_450841 [Aspergillus brunneoviolaceus CBS 621.78]|uniref:Uncharacterized protein n=1 Tax=Aspergillus brunneoviolaceus CBS 621.78 TaxID=1450534 RepID=A0ACD1GII0_9EURO|nr:hypothetical protein BO95DRAFT_450841 [Aspergillus brunneoviolaceus CBS 621.78]RAH48963.1 hypothetical protein BO95DRAFT_450841 [Aspergillus brunneoviolaceus CBS 621.78]